MIPELPVEKLRRACDPDMMGCSDSSQISSLKTIIGQERAVRALQFGLGIKEKGFNIYVAGLPGEGADRETGRHHPGEQHEQPHAQRGGGGRGSRGEVPYLAGEEY